MIFTFSIAGHGFTHLFILFFLVEMVMVSLICVFKFPLKQGTKNLAKEREQRVSNVN